ncbi:MAG: tetratricopeptide repeat protein, partial [Nitrospirae bacterium]|nr:tetratricopeptide repeat protein [Nitrospirota bacterium]
MSRPAKRKALSNSGRVYVAMEKYPEAIAYFENLMKNLPESPDVYLYMGILYFQTNDYAKSEEMFKKGLALSDKNVELNFRLAMVYEKIRKYEEMFEQLKITIGLDPDNVDALNYLGYTYADQGINLDEALELIKKAVSLGPDNGYVRDSLGWVFYKKGLFDDAVREIKKALDLTKDDPVIYDHLGDVYLKMGDKIN